MHIYIYYYYYISIHFHPLISNMLCTSLRHIEVQSEVLSPIIHWKTNLASCYRKTAGVFYSEWNVDLRNFAEHGIPRKSQDLALTIRTDIYNSTHFITHIYVALPQGGL